MFNPGVIRQLAKDHYQTFMKLQAVEKRLKARFADMDEVVDALILSAHYAWIGSNPEDKPDDDEQEQKL